MSLAIPLQDIIEIGPEGGHSHTHLAAFPLPSPSGLSRSFLADAVSIVIDVEIDPITGKVVILTIAGGANETATDLDKWLARHGAG